MKLANENEITRRRRERGGLFSRENDSDAGWLTGFRGCLLVVWGGIISFHGTALARRQRVDLTCLGVVPFRSNVRSFDEQKDSEAVLKGLICAVSGWHIAIYFYWQIRCDPHPTCVRGDCGWLFKCGIDSGNLKSHLEHCALLIACAAWSQESIMYKQVLYMQF